MTPDIAGKLPGRGAWVSSSRDAVDQAVRKNAFARAFRRPVTAPEDLADQVETALRKSALSVLGLARRAGDVAVGFEKVRAALKDGGVAALVEAADGAADGRRKLAAQRGSARVVEIFAGSELSAALGFDGAVHVALKDGPGAARFLRELRRLEGFGREARNVEEQGVRV